ncbi:MAG: hypothetical protein M9894_05605 [Planctomycetes bacterium]|nr:hypothetical protein [Planctomycetota bacterium]
MTPKEFAANLLAEVKLAEKRLEKAREKLEPQAERIKAALRAGDRAAAEKLALSYEQAKDDVARAEADVARAKEEFEQGKRKAADAERNARTLRSAQALGGALGAFNEAMGTVDAAEDMLRRLEEEAAIAEARVDLALDAAGEPPPPPPPPRPEDLLKEFES